MKMKWLTRIQRAIKRGKFTRNDYLHAVAWETCAVGEVSGDRPKPDSTLWTLGVA